MPRAIGIADIAFRFRKRRQRPGVHFRGWIPDLYVPLSTLRLHPCEWLRMTQGRLGSLPLTVRLFHSLHLAGLSRRTYGVCPLIS